MNLFKDMELIKLLGKVTITAATLRSAPTAANLAAASSALAELSTFVSKNGPEAAEKLKKLTSAALDRAKSIDTTGIGAELQGLIDVFKGMSAKKNLEDAYSGGPLPKAPDFDASSAATVASVLERAQAAIKGAMPKGKNLPSQEIITHLETLAQQIRDGKTTITVGEMDASVFESLAHRIRNQENFESLKATAVDGAQAAWDRARQAVDKMRT
jgi:hypothetical protein